ncbi:MAG: glycosyltransferase family 4 protein [Blastocatellales bacterium]
MNIALVVHDLHENGGHSLYTRVLADALAARHRVMVFANQCERPANAAWQHQPVAAWRVNALASVQTFPLGLRRWRDELARFDICHAQGFCGGRPNVVTAHICQASYLASLRDVSARTRTSLQLMLAAEERFYRRYDGHIIAISKLVAEDLRRHYGVRSPISVIPHGVDRRRFNTGNRDLHRARVRAELGIGAAETVALYVGDLTKAHSHLKSLAAATPEIQFVIVTRSQTYHWTAPNVRIAPATRQPERYYAAADAFVFPSTYDAFGMVVLEAMASGLAVFCSDRAGAAELITTGSDGVTLSLDEWVEGTRMGLRDRARLDALGQQAAITAERHGWQSVVDKVERVYFGIADCTEIRKSTGSGYG